MQTHPCSAKPRLMFVVTEDWYFCSHRLPLAKAAIDAGFDVSVATRVQRHGEAIKGSGVRLIPTCLRRSGRNPITESRAIAELRSLYAAERPDIVHHVAAKPVLYGSLAAKLAGVPNVVNAMAGLGFIFSSQGLRASLMRRFLSSAYSWALRGPTVTPVFQNQDDISLFEGLGILPPGKARLIKSSGVDLQRFRAKPEPSLGPGQSPVIILPSRLLWDKGVGEFVEASRIIKERGIRARFILIGDPDAENPACVPVPILSAWRDEALVEWQRWREDMPTAFADCHIVCLPSYREGLPKVLLEAAACTRPIVTTDVPGCREIVRHEENGLLVPSRDPQALADALQTLICSPQARQRFGSRGREIAAEFSLERVIDQTLGLYQEILARDRQTA
ncbi:MAG: glycosyltransferase family 4 protein [Elusimicrobia bacterium]|nr:glycosyltransferase family 4 protein [Elusimicrobiota bacterium]